MALKRPNERIEVGDALRLNPLDPRVELGDGGGHRLRPVQDVVEPLAQPIRRFQGGLPGRGGLQGIDFRVSEAVILLEKQSFERFVCPFLRRFPAQVLPELVQAVVE